MGVVAGPAVGTYRKPVDKPVAGPVQRLVGNLKGVCGVACGGERYCGERMGPVRSLFEKPVGGPLIGACGVSLWSRGGGTVGGPVGGPVEGPLEQGKRPVGGPLGEGLPCRGACGGPAEETLARRSVATTGGDLCGCL